MTIPEIQKWPPPPPPPPTQYYLGYAYICLFPPLKAPPYLRTDKISEPPFRGLCAGFSCLGDPPKFKTLLKVPPYILFYNPLFKFLRHSKRERKKNHPVFKRNLRVKSQIPPFFYNSRAGLCRTKSTSLPEILGTRMRSLRPRRGGRGGGAGKWPFFNGDILPIFTPISRWIKEKAVWKYPPIITLSRGKKIPFYTLFHAKSRTKSWENRILRIELTNL